MTSRFKNLAGGNGAATVAWSLDARETGAMRRRGYPAGQSPCLPTVVGRGHRLAAAIEAGGLRNRRQLKI